MSAKIPQQVSKALESQKYGEALAICRQMKIDPQFVRSKIENQIALADTAFNNGEYQKSIDLFKTTIGGSEPSLVLSKFFQPQFHHLVIDYLVELHIRGFANPSYTKLLFNLFIQSQSRDVLHNFIDMISNATKIKKQRLPNLKTFKDAIIKKQFSKGQDKEQKDDENNEQSKTKTLLQNFDINIAIEMLKKGGLNEEASKLSQAVGISMSSISSLIDEKKYNEAATQIFDHFDEPIGYAMLMRFGPTLLKNDANSGKIVEQTATLIWKTNREQNDTDFIKLFWDHPQNCVGFLRSIIHEKPTELFADTLVSLLIPKTRPNLNSFFGNPNIAKADEAMSLITDKRLPINCLNLLTICSESGFVMGTAQLLTRIGRSSDALSMLIQENATTDIVRWITMKPNLSPEDWFRLFSVYVAEDGWKQLPPLTKAQFMQNVISNIKDTALFARIVSALMTNKDIPIDVLKNAPADTLNNIQIELQKARRARSGLTNEITKLGKKIKNIEVGNIEFNPNMCAECGEEVAMPYVAFFCGHCVHSRCAVRNEKGKPICQTCIAESMLVSRKANTYDADRTKPTINKQ